MTGTDGVPAQGDEFHGAPAADPVPMAETARRGDGVVPVVGWLLAAGLALAAPFADVARIVFDAPGRRDDRILSMDGWGRSEPAASFGVGHGPQYGILLAVCAGGLVVAALLLLARRRALDPDADYSPPHPLGLLAVGAPAALAAAAAALYLAADSLVDQANHAPGERPGNGFGLRAEYGMGIWLVAAAAVCAVVATALYLGQVRADEYELEPDELTA
jgi:hypothetical protein